MASHHERIVKVGGVYRLRFPFSMPQEISEEIYKYMEAQQISSPVVAFRELIIVGLSAQPQVAAIKSAYMRALMEARQYLAMNIGEAVKRIGHDYTNMTQFSLRNINRNLKEDQPFEDP